MKRYIILSLIFTFFISIVSCNSPKKGGSEKNQEKEESSPRMSFSEYHNAGLDAFIERNYEEAKKLFTEAHAFYPDSLSKEQLAAYYEEILLKQEKELIRTEKGDWQAKYFVDEFGDNTNEGYIGGTFKIEGAFSNSATTDSDLHVSLYINNQKKVFVSLYEYADENYTVNPSSYDDYYSKVKFSDGTEGKYYLEEYTDRLGFKQDASKKIIEEMKAGRPFKVFITDLDTPTDKYVFEVENFLKFNEAYKEIFGEE